MCSLEQHQYKVFSSRCQKGFHALVQKKCHLPLKYNLLGGSYRPKHKISYNRFFLGKKLFLHALSAYIIDLNFSMA